MAPKITEDHVRYAIGLMKASLSTLTDEVDYGVYNSSRTKSQTERIHAIKKTIQTICSKEKCAKIAEISSISGFDSLEVEHTLMLLERNKEVYRFQEGYRIP
jgi:DNA replicative helicase MCM subunit Mcm2 (Cdc46/Mcm family)